MSNDFSAPERESITSRLQRAAKLRADQQPGLPVMVELMAQGAAATDPTFDLRRRQANLCEAVMIRVFELEAQAAVLTETAKKLRAAVLANT
jgi:hypothetical protein